MKSVNYLVLCLVVLIGACASIPAQEMSDARQAVQAARDLGAATHAPERLNRAEDLLDQAKQALDAGQYDAGRAHALAAKGEAAQARTQALQTQPPAASP